MFSKALKHILYVLMFLAMSVSLPAETMQQTIESDSATAPLDVKEMILDHLKDSYEWHIATFKDKKISIPTRYPV